MIAEINEDRDGVRRREDASKHGLDELSLVALCGVGRSDGDVVGRGMIRLPLLGIEVTVLVSARGVVLLLLSLGDKGMSFGALVGSTAVRGIRRAFVRGGAAARATAARTRRWARRVRAARMFAAFRCLALAGGRVASSVDAFRKVPQKFTLEFSMILFPGNSRASPGVARWRTIGFACLGGDACRARE